MLLSVSDRWQQHRPKCPLDTAQKVVRSVVNLQAIVAERRAGTAGQRGREWGLPFAALHASSDSHVVNLNFAQVKLQ